MPNVISRDVTRSITCGRPPCEINHPIYDTNGLREMFARSARLQRTCSRRTSASKSVSSPRFEALAAASALAASVAALSVARAALRLNLCQHNVLAMTPG